MNPPNPKDPDAARLADYLQELGPMDYFGSTGPQKMPSWFFSGALRLHESTARRGDPFRQSCSVAPRFWYMDADFRCCECQAEFTWTADEQKVWFEEYRFWVGSVPKRCRKCCRRHHLLREYRREYDSRVAEAKAGGSHELLARMVFILAELEQRSGPLPVKMKETRASFEKRLARQP